MAKNKNTPKGNKKTPKKPIQGTVNTGSSTSTHGHKGGGNAGSGPRVPEQPKFRHTLRMGPTGKKRMEHIPLDGGDGH